MITGDRRDLSRLRDMIEARFGLAFPDSQLPVLERKLERALRDLRLETFGEACRHLEGLAPSASSPLVEALTVGETYFLRNREHFEALRQKVIPELLAKMDRAAPLVIWSAGCSTGEEPYSLSMWFYEHFPELWRTRLRIIATDLNGQSVRKAGEGVYSDWSFRHVEEYWRTKYFHPSGKSRAFDPSLRSPVSFRVHNLLDDHLPEGLTPQGAAVIFCRNVFIYFMANTSARVLKLFRTALTPEGVLFTGHAESAVVLSTWRALYFTGTYYYRPPASDQPVPTAEPALPVVRSAPPASTCSPVRVPVASRPALAVDRPAGSAAGSTIRDVRAASNAGRHEEARRMLDDLMRREKTSVEGHLLQAMVAEQLGDSDGALGALRRALFLDKKLVVGHYLMAVLNERLGRQDDALRKYSTVHHLLGSARDGDLLPLSEGLTAGRLRELTEARLQELSGAGRA